MYSTSPDSCSSSFAAVTPADSDLAVPARALYVGGAGDVAVKALKGGQTVVFKAVPAGAVLPISVSQVRATDTTATYIVALY